MFLEKLFVCLASVLLLFGFSNNRSFQNPIILNLNQVLNEHSDDQAGPVMQIIKLKSSLSEEILLQKARERKPKFEAIEGLLQKYYLKLSNDGEYAGVYIWDSPESLAAYRDSELAKSIPEAYLVTEPPSVETIEILFQLR